MDVLVVLAVAGFDAGLGTRVHPQRQARLPATVELHQFTRGELCGVLVVQNRVPRERSHVPEPTPPQAGMQADRFGNVEVILQVHASLVAERLF